MKKSLVLLKALIFHYHGLDQDEKKILETYVDTVDARAEYEWAISFISQDYMSAFERAKKFLAKNMKPLDAQTKLQYLIETWEDNHIKGYVTEMETTAMLNLAKDWSIEKDFLISINHN
ncbi:MAG: hypothetical protein ACO2ZZ_01245 [Cyclobacteriaceae bacterium]